MDNWKGVNCGRSSSTRIDELTRGQVEARGLAISK
jgi:hypothetical protein